MKALIKDVYKALIKDMATEMPRMAGVLDIARDLITKKLNAIAKKLKGDALKAFKRNRNKREKGLLDAVADATEKDIKKLQRITKRYREVLKQLADARDKLANLKAEKQAFQDAVMGDLMNFAGLGGLQKPQDVFGNEEDWTVSNISGQLAQKLAAVKEFGKNLKTLLDMGFSNRVYRQIIEMGIIDGAAFAAALIKATPDEVSNINTLVDNIHDTSKDLADAAGSQLYDAGIAAAQGLIDGLLDKKKDLEKIAEELGKAIARAIKRALKMKSPSRVGIDIGKNFGGAVARGLWSEVGQVSRASEALAKAMTFDPNATYSSSRGLRYSPVVGSRTGSAPGQTPTVQQEISITTQEIDPRRHAAQLGWELAARFGV